MAYPVSADYVAALKADQRDIDVRARIHNAAGEVVYGPLVLDDQSPGTITWDWRNHMDGPVTTCDLTAIDPGGDLIVDISAGPSNNLWFGFKVEVDYGLVLADGSTEYCPAFRGYVETVGRQFDTALIGCVGKEARHQPPYALPHSWQVLAGTTWTQAISDLLNDRWIEDDLIDFSSVESDPKAQRNYQYGMGMSPWRMYQEWAEFCDRQLLWRQDGHIALRDWPTNPAWSFYRNDSSIVLEWPDPELSMDNIFNETFVTNFDRVVNDGPQLGTRPEPIVGFAKLPPSDPLSREQLNPGKPALRFFERQDARTFDRANQLARGYLDGGAHGLESTMRVVSLPLPHLEAMDVLTLGFADVGVDEHSFRAHNFAYDLGPDGTMTTNYGGRLPHVRNARALSARSGHRGADVNWLRQHGLL